jgi:hypothetical protein
MDYHAPSRAAVRVDRPAPPAPRRPPVGDIQRPQLPRPASRHRTAIGDFLIVLLVLAPAFILLVAR